MGDPSLPWKEFENFRVERIFNALCSVLCFLRSRIGPSAYSMPVYAFQKGNGSISGTCQVCLGKCAKVAEIIFRRSSTSLFAIPLNLSRPVHYGEKLVKLTVCYLRQIIVPLRLAQPVQSIKLGSSDSPNGNTNEKRLGIGAY